MYRVLAIAALLAALVSGRALADDCKFSERRDFDVDAASLKTLALDLGASDATIEGVAGLTKVEVRGRICASSKEGLAPFQVEHKREGDRLIVTVRHESSAVNISIGGVRYAGLKLAVRMPRDLALKVDAAAGDVDVSSVASLDFKSSAGDLKLNDIAGAVVLDLAAGDVEGGGLGSLEVKRAAAGDIKLHDVHGDARLAGISAGDLHLDKVGGSVEIGNIDTGDVRLGQIAHDVRVQSLGTGDLDVDGVGGDLVVRSHGLGDITHRNVRGKVEVPRDSMGEDSDD